MDKYKALLLKLETLILNMLLSYYLKYMVLCIYIIKSLYYYFYYSFHHLLFFLASQWFQEQGRYFYGQHKFPDEETGNSSLKTWIYIYISPCMCGVLCILCVIFSVMLLYYIIPQTYLFWPKIMWLKWLSGKKMFCN